MSETYDRNVFGFKDKNEMWDAIMLILRENIEIESATAFNVNTIGEARAHACGRAEALRDLKNVLMNEREIALERLKDQIIG